MGDGFPVFRRRQFPMVGSRKVREGAERPTPAKRGYDHIWDGLSRRFRRSNPFCLFCEQRGLEAQPADVVDHIIPVADAPHLRLTYSNLVGLCHTHHNNDKRWMERAARERGDITVLTEWVKNPSARPRRFRR